MHGKRREDRKKEPRVSTFAPVEAKLRPRVSASPVKVYTPRNKPHHIKNNPSRVQTPTTSLFDSIHCSHIMEETKSKFGRGNSKDILNAFGLSELWQEANPFVKREGPHVVPNMEHSYTQICQVFSKLSLQFSMQSDVGRYSNRAFTEDFMFVAILSIQHTYNIIIDKLGRLLEAEETNWSEECEYKDLNDLYDTLKTFNDFFFITAKLKCNTVLSEHHLKVLQDTTKLPFTFLQQKVQNNLALTLPRELQERNRSTIAYFLYHVLQTVAALAIFGEPEVMSKGKYENIIERFKSIFALLAQSMACEKIFCEVHSFEPLWGKYKKKMIVSSFDQKRLSIFLQKFGKTEMTIEFSLKYVVISYNYKILRLITQRTQHIKYDEHIFSVFSSLAYKNRIALGALVNKKIFQDEMELTLLINENIYIIKSYILSLVVLSEGLDPIQRQSKYETIKDIVLDSIHATIKCFSHSHPIQDKGVFALTIYSPKDLLGLIFKSLLTFKKCLNKNPSVAHSKEIATNINTLLTELISRPIPTDNPICSNIYKIYLLQCIQSWDAEFLKEKHVKYTEEMCRYLSTFEDTNTGSFDSELLFELNGKVKELALEILVRLSQVDCGPVIEAMVVLVRDNFANERKQRNFFYVLTCVLTRHIIPLEFFPGLLCWDREQSISVFAEQENGAEFKAFILKGGMQVLFTNFRNTLASYKHTKAQTKQYDLYIGKTCTKNASNDAYDFALTEHLKKLNSTVDSYKNLLESTASFICALHNVPFFTERFLFHSDWAQELTDTTLALKGCQKLVSELTVVLKRNTKNSEKLLDKFVAFCVSMLRRIHLIETKHKNKRGLLLHFISLFKSLVSGKVGETVQRKRKIMFEKAVVPVFVDICRSGIYKTDVDVFLSFLRLGKFIVRDNPLFHDNSEANAQLNDFYNFILEWFKSFKRIDVAKETLNELMEMCVDSPFCIGSQAIVKDIVALENYYEVLYICFKDEPGQSEDELDSYVLEPLKAFLNSLYNVSVIARSKVPYQLLKIFKRTANTSLACMLSNYIGDINVTHTTPKQVKRLLRYYCKLEKREDVFLEKLLEIFLYTISGESIKEFFYFDGSPKSYIFICNSEAFAYPVPGVCFTGYVRFEKSQTYTEDHQNPSGLERESQCIFSFLNTTKKTAKFFELGVSKQKFKYRVSGSKGESIEVLFEDALVKEDIWQRITLFQTNKEILFILDDSSWTKELPETPAYSKSYNVITFGAKIDVEKTLPTDHLHGELSALCFFTPSTKLKEPIKSLAEKESMLPYMYLNEKYQDCYFFETPSWTERKTYQQEFMANHLLIVDPRKLYFIETPKGPVNAKTLQKAQIFYNRPGKEVFCNLGGLRVALPLIMDRVYTYPSPGKHDLAACIGISKLLHCLCINKCVQAIKFLTEENGLDFLQLLFEKIGKYNGYSKAFVDSIFNILYLPILYHSWEKYRLAPLIIEKIVLNIAIWSNSEFPVQVHLLDRVNDFLLQQKCLRFSKTEPFASLLFMLFDYLTPEEHDIYETQTFLREIRTHLKEIIHNQLINCSNFENVQVFLKYLTPNSDKFNQLKDVLSIISRYQLLTAKTQRRSIFQEFLYKPYGKDSDGKGQIGLVTSLFLIIHTTISHKHQLNAIIANSGPDAQAQIDCMEDIIALTVDILLSLNWSKMQERFMDIPAVKYAFNPLLVPKTVKKGPDDKILHLLKPSHGFKSTDEVILAYILQRLNYDRSKYEKNYLGVKVYQTILKRVFTKALTLSQLGTELSENVQKMSETELNIPYCATLYRVLMQNLSAFELPLRAQIFLDLEKVLTNPILFAAVLQSEDIALRSIRYLNKKKYLLNPTLKAAIEGFLILFLMQNWSSKHMKPFVGAMLVHLQKLNQVIFVEFLNELIKKLAASPMILQSEEGTCNLIQMVYEIEDFATENSIALVDPQFAITLSMLTLLLNKAGLLYFWYPSFSTGAFQHSSMLEYDPKCTQREGSVVRVVLRVLFAMLIKMNDIGAESIVVKTLEFFILHDKGSQDRLLEDLIKSQGVAVEVLKNEADPTINFMQFSRMSSKKVTFLIKTKVKAIASEKSIAQQKSIEDLSDPGKDVYEFVGYKLLLLFTYLAQIIIYTTLKVDSYKDISFFRLESERPQELPQKVKELLFIAGKLITEYGFPGPVISEVDKRCSRIGKSSIRNCFSDIDMLPKLIVNPSQYEPATPSSRIFTSKNYVEYTFECSPPGSDSTYSSVDQTTCIVTFKEELLKVFKEISQEYASCRDKATSKESYLNTVSSLILSTNYIKVIQTGLHELITEDFKFIDKAIYLYNYKKVRVSRKSTGYVARPVEKLEDIKTLLILHSKDLHSDKSLLVDIGEKKSSNNTCVDEYEALRKRLLSDKPFVKRDELNQKAYKLVAAHYLKLLARCPLHKVVAQKKCYSQSINKFKTFVKLNLRRDNLGRAMRLKPMKRPLNSPSILKGISYMRQFFLKRVMISHLVAQYDYETENALVCKENFLVKDPVTEAVLIPLFQNLKRKLRPATIYRQMSTPRVTHRMFNCMLNQKVSPELNTSYVSRSQIFTESRESQRMQPTFEGEIIKVDTAVFGIFYLTKMGIIYEKRIKDPNKVKYRLGCSKEMSCDSSCKARRVWKFADISKIVLRRHNLIKQAFEIFLLNQKSVFILLFSEENLNSFYGLLRKKIAKYKLSVSLTDEAKMETELQKAKEDWRKKRLTTFEYLMQLNFYSGRSFQDLSQYPVFPWVIQDYQSPEVFFAKSLYRDFKYPMAGINEHKRTEAVNKYVNTEDFPGGAFQYGAHYLPGRAVLGYLMRLQPFTHMIYRFDAGGDCPARHFHFMEKMWKNIQKECDINLELIPEFYYCPEFLANLYY